VAYGWRTGSVRVAYGWRTGGVRMAYGLAVGGAVGDKCNLVHHLLDV
jgi:hypothetical protein